MSNTLIFSNAGFYFQISGNTRLKGLNQDCRLAPPGLDCPCGGAHGVGGGWESVTPAPGQPLGTPWSSPHSRDTHSKQWL